MVSRLVRASVNQAYDALLIPSDIWYFSTNFQQFGLHALAVDMHAEQTTAQSLITFADRTCEAWHNVLEMPIIECYAMVAALTIGHRSLHTAMHYATRLAEVIVRKNRGEPDDRKYRRIIPAGLADLQMTSMDAITVDVLQRILRVDPWLTYLQRVEAMRNRLVRSLQNYMLQELQDFIAERTTSSVTAVRQPPDQRTRKSIRKAVRLFERLYDRSELRAFLASVDGPALVIPGKRYDYHVSMAADSLLKYTVKLNEQVTPVTTCVFDKAGNELADICVYFRDMPILDHLIAFKLNVSNEETEWDILRGMNVQSVTRKFYSDPLAEFKGIHDPLQAPRSFINNFALYLNEDDEAVPRTGLAYEAFFRTGNFGPSYESLMRRAHFSLLYATGESGPTGLPAAIESKLITDLFTDLGNAAQDGRL